MTNIVEFEVRVIPRSSRSEIVGMHDGALKIKLRSPPVDGAANDELVRLLSREFACAKSEVEIISGKTSKTKRIRLRGVNGARFDSVLKAKS